MSMPTLVHPTTRRSAVLDRRFRANDCRHVVHWETRDGMVGRACAHFLEKGQDALLDAITIGSDRAHRLIDEGHLELLFVPHGARAYRDATIERAVKQ